MHELKDYLSLFRKHLRLILGGAFVVAVGALLVAYFLPPCYEASATLYVARKVEESEGDYFTYEGYYGQQTAERYTETVVGFLTSEDIIRQALRKVAKSDDPEAVKEVFRNLKARRTAPQLVSLKVKQRSAPEAQYLWKALSEAVIETTNYLNQESDKKLTISLLEVEPLVKDKKPVLWLSGLIGFMVGFFAFAAIASLMEYLD